MARRLSVSTAQLTAQLLTAQLNRFTKRRLRSPAQLLTAQRLYGSMAIAFCQADTKRCARREFWHRTGGLT